MTRSRFVPAIALGLTTLLSACLADRSGSDDVVTDNLPPVALIDIASVMVDSTNNPIDVLANDTDPNGDTLIIESAVVTSTVPFGEPGTLEIQPGGGLLRFTPPAGFIGLQALQYTVSDGHGGSAIAAVTVTVLPLALPPVAVPDVYTVATDSAATTLDVLANDIDGAGGGLTIDSASLIATVPPGSPGTVEIVDDTLSYTPPAGFIGAESLQYTMIDANGATATTTVLVTVLPVTAPPIAAPDVFTVAPDSVALELDVLANDIDLTGTGLTLTAVAALATVPPGSAGTFTIENDRVIYTPASGFVGVETAQYTVTSGGGQNAIGSIAILVAPVISGIPPFAIADAALVSTNSTGTAISVLTNDIDASGTGLTVTAVERLAAVPPTAADTLDTDGTVVNYAPAAGYAGVVTLTYTIADGNGQTSTAPIVITVSGAALPPIAVADIVTVQQDSAPINIAALTNDIDLSSTGLDITSVAGITTLPPGQTGSFTVAADGQSIIYQPLPGFVGVETLSYGVADGNGGASTGVITIAVQSEVLAVPPLALPDLATVTQDSGATLIAVLSNDISPTGAALTVTEVSQLLSLPDAAHTVALSGNQVSFTPAAGFAGVVTLQYTVSDGTNTATGTVAITVTPGALVPAPVALPDIGLATSGIAPAPVAYTVLANDIDPAGGGLTLTAASITLALPPGAGSVGIVGNQVVYTPTALYTGSVTVTYTAQDSLSRTTTGVLVITVTAL
ncbi:MAG: Ig-like domain-containing protein [Sinimarinibacterium sp.]|jgi:hypothetical protein